MPKKILVIDDAKGGMPKLKQRRWEILHNFEHKQRELFLKNLTINEGIKIFSDLYQFAQKIGDKVYYKNLDLKKVNALSKVHSMFMNVTQ